MEHSAVTAPHVVALPFPIETHIKPLLNLAKLLSHRGGIRFTFVNTHHHHARLHHFTNLQAFHAQFPGFRFASITDGLPPDVPPGTLDAAKLLVTPACRSKVAAELRRVLAGLLHGERKEETAGWGPPLCVVADSLMLTIAVDVAREFRVPVIAFRPYSATCTWVTLHTDKLIQEGVIPVRDPEDMEKLVTSIPGLENLFRGRDLPTIFRLKPGDFYLDFCNKEAIAMGHASALIVNTFDQLESPIISHLTTIFPKVYAIGPLHAFVNTHFTNNIDDAMRKEDRSCVPWLDHQNPKSVLYVSFGTGVMLSRDQLLEFWHGLVNSLRPFLWVIRKDMIFGGSSDLDQSNLPEELVLGTKLRGLIVEWAPQLEVLAHPAVGGFLTHCGWNSTLESIAEGVPMLCWPWMTDQTTNCRSVSEQWRIGLDMSGACDRVVVEKMVRDLMENQKEGLMKSAGEIAKMAADSVKQNGSSYHNLENLIEDIRAMKVIH